MAFLEMTKPDGFRAISIRPCGVVRAFSWLSIRGSELLGVGLATTANQLTPGGPPSVATTCFVPKDSIPGNEIRRPAGREGWRAVGAGRAERAGCARSEAIRSDAPGARLYPLIRLFLETSQLGRPDPPAMSSISSGSSSPKAASRIAAGMSIV